MSKDSENKIILDLPLSDFLEVEKIDLKRADKLRFMDKAQEIIEKKSGLPLLVQGVWGTGKSTFLKFLFFYHKRQSSEKHFVPILMTPRYFEVNSFYSYFFLLLKSELLKVRYSSELSNAIDDLLKIFSERAEGRIHIIVGYFFDDGEKDVEQKLGRIIRILKNEYKDCYIVIGIDEIDRLCNSDIIEAGKLLEMIKKTNERLCDEVDFHVVMCWDDKYLTALKVSGSYEDPLRGINMSEYFGRFRGEQINIDHFFSEQILQHAHNEFSKIFTEPYLSSKNMVREDEAGFDISLLKGIRNELRVKRIPFAIRDIKKIYEFVNYNVGSFSQTKDFVEVGINDILTPQLKVLLIYFSFLYHFRIGLYTQTESIIQELKDPLLFLDQNKEKEDAIKSRLYNIHPFLEGYEYNNVFDIHSDRIFDLIRIDEDSILSFKKEVYIEDYIVKMINIGRVSDAISNIKKYKNILLRNDFTQGIRDKIRVNINDNKYVKDDDKIGYSEKYITQIIDIAHKFESTHAANSIEEGDSIFDNGRNLYWLLDRVLHKYNKDKDFSMAAELIYDVVQKVKSSELNKTSKLIRLLQFYWKTRLKENNSKFKEVVNQNLDLKTLGKEINIQGNIFAVSENSKSSYYFGYEVLCFIKEHFSSGDQSIDIQITKNLKDYYKINSKDAFVTTRYFIELFQHDSNSGVFDNLSGFLDLCSNEFKIKLLFYCCKENQYSAIVVKEEFKELVKETKRSIGELLYAVAERVDEFYIEKMPANHIPYGPIEKINREENKELIDKVLNYLSDY